ncbi:ATP-binding cassette sub-family C member 4 [Frankliniella occidentalis]|uniref:ATP-binding cassette sub-family C member 4 n=1 Tax=Frankliniella occidentalis TaxID=133901 RepID=A0A9C6U3R5_FRAOC|nr:ATP-binding cassette sub-family C member 4 [Frankliniella occidentalis]
MPTDYHVTKIFANFASGSSSSFCFLAAKGSVREGRAISFPLKASLCRAWIICCFFIRVLHVYNFLISFPAGRILNRFSKDLGSIDELLPKALLDATQFILAFFGYIVVSVSVDWIFIIPVIVLLVIFWMARVVYLMSAKNIKRLEGMTRSPVFTHLNATIQGLSTIRAFNAEDLVKVEFDNHQNLHSAAWYMGVMTSMSFGTALDLLSLSFSIVVIFSFLLLQQSDDFLGGDVGLAITQSMAMTGMVQFGMRQSAEVASQLLSVERVLEYADLPTEDKDAASGPAPKPDWPAEGRVELKNVWMRYAPEDPPVLKGLTLTINPTEKVGIVGRTGAGKSSLIAALFRLAYLEGRVVLDDVDTGSLPLQQLRSRISIIPQDPVLFSGDLRRNLDPFGEYKDHQLWAALGDVELRDTASDSGGLEMRVADAGANFSVGQRQLICLARAILRGNKLLMLDEATANVDPQTDALIQSTIRTKFARCTVLTVAHRLNTIMDSDRVLVMDAGRAAEFDHPYMLIQKRGIFYSLVQETGHQMADTLAKIARENYENKITSGQY